MQAFGQLRHAQVNFGAGVGGGVCRCCRFCVGVGFGIVFSVGGVGGGGGAVGGGVGVFVVAAAAAAAVFGYGGGGGAGGGVGVVVGDAGDVGSVLRGGFVCSIAWGLLMTAS